jgi:hypothetical protein
VKDPGDRRDRETQPEPPAREQLARAAQGMLQLDARRCPGALVLSEKSELRHRSAQQRQSDTDVQQQQPASSLAVSSMTRR